MWFSHWKWGVELKKYEKLGVTLTESFNLSEQNPTHKPTEAVNVNEHLLLKQVPEGDIGQLGL